MIVAFSHQVASWVLVIQLLNNNVEYPLQIFKDDLFIIYFDNNFSGTLPIDSLGFDVSLLVTYIVAEFQKAFHFYHKINSYYKKPVYLYSDLSKNEAISW